MNGIPVYPLPKNGERPYLAPPKTLFRTLFLPDFGCILVPISTLLTYQCQPPLTPNHQFIILLFIFNLRNQSYTR